MYDVHAGLRIDSKAKPKAEYRERDIQLNKKLGKGFFRYKIESDIERFTKKCDQYKNRLKL